MNEYDNVFIFSFAKNLKKYERKKLSVGKKKKFFFSGQVKKKVTRLEGVGFTLVQDGCDCYWLIR